MKWRITFLKTSRKLLKNLKEFKTNKINIGLENNETNTIEIYRIIKSIFEKTVHQQIW